MSSATAELAIVADSSPLIGLARIGQLELLRRFAKRVAVPPAVWEEVSGHSYDAPGAKEVRAAEWLAIEKPPDPDTVASLNLLVDRGEAEAIALAQSIPSSLLLVDDSRARRVAQRLGVRLVGTVGLLGRAKKMGWIPQLRPHLEALQRNGIYIRQELIEAVLADVGE
jgi:predicted nucleic acid-binding protein